MTFSLYLTIGTFFTFVWFVYVLLSDVMEREQNKDPTKGFVRVESNLHYTLRILLFAGISVIAWPVFVVWILWMLVSMIYFWTR